MQHCSKRTARLLIAVVCVAAGIAVPVAAGEAVAQDSRVAVSTVDAEEKPAREGTRLRAFWVRPTDASSVQRIFAYVTGPHAQRAAATLAADPGGVVNGVLVGERRACAPVVLVPRTEHASIWSGTAPVACRWRLIRIQLGDRAIEGSALAGLLAGAAKRHAFTRHLPEAVRGGRRLVCPYARDGKAKGCVQSQRLLSLRGAERACSEMGGTLPTAGELLGSRAWLRALRRAGTGFPRYWTSTAFAAGSRARLVYDVRRARLEGRLPESGAYTVCSLATPR